MRIGKRFAVLLLAAAVLGIVGGSRSFEYDEAYSVFVTSPTPRPAWPDRVFRVGEVRGLFHAHAGPVAIATALRRTDVHPPLYFWVLAAWRVAVGDGFFRMRLLSVLCALAALALVGRIARLSAIPPAPAMLLTLGSYGFAYTGAIARDFAMAQALTLAGTLLVLAAERRPDSGGSRESGHSRNGRKDDRSIRNESPPSPCGRGLGGGVRASRFGVREGDDRKAGTPPPTPSHKGRGDSAGDARFRGNGGENWKGSIPAAAAGLCLGAATLTNYLAAFVAAAVLGWLTVVAWRRPRLWLAGGFACAAMLPAVLWFFLAQRGSRPGQFPPFHLMQAMRELARYGAASLLGGLPLYAPPPLRIATAAALGVFTLALAASVALRWRRIATPTTRWLFLAGAVAPAAGLLALGLVFDNTPIELRYLCFAVPFAALLLAGALARSRVLLGALAWVQALSLVGLAFSPATMQPFRRIAAEAWARAGPRGVILAPLGNDGLGAVVPLLAELPADARVRLIPEGQAATIVRALPSGTRAVVARVQADAASRATVAELDRALNGS